METLYRNLLLISALSLSLTLPGRCLADEVISAAEVQHFEQTYEDWAGKIIKSIHPKIEFTIIARVELSANPEKLSAYEEAKVAQHLPGLPEVSDPSYSNPLESPLLPLLEKRILKVYLRSAVNAEQERVIREVIQAKMKLSSNDILQFEHSLAGVTAKTPNKSGKTAPLLALIAGMALIASAVIGKKGMKRISSGIRFGERTPVEAGGPPSPALSPSIQISNAQPAALREALAQERVDVIAKASMNATRRFSHQILGEMDQPKFDLVNQWIERNKGAVTTQDSTYARLILSARLQQITNQHLLKSIEGFSRMKTLKQKIERANKKLSMEDQSREVTA